MRVVSPPRPAPPQIPRAPWVLRGSNRRLYAAVVGVGLVVYGISYSVDRLLNSIHVAQGSLLDFSDAITALLAAILAFTLMRNQQKRRAAVLQRLAMVAEMNHHIRNALHVIQMSAHTTRDATAIREINDAVKRVDWVLNEILGTQAEAPRIRKTGD